MASKAQEIRKAEKNDARLDGNAKLGEKLRDEASTYGHTIGLGERERTKGMESARKAAVALAGLVHESFVGKLSHPQDSYISILERGIWFEIHRELGKGAPEFKASEMPPGPRAITRDLRKIAIAYSLDGYSQVLNMETNKWEGREHVRETLLNHLAQDRGFNKAVVYARDVVSKHERRALNDLEYAKHTGFSATENKVRRVGGAKSVSDARKRNVEESIRLMSLEQCYDMMSTMKGAFMSRVPDCPNRINVITQIGGEFDKFKDQLHTIFATAQALLAPATSPRLDQEAARADELAEAAKKKAEQVAVPARKRAARKQAQEPEAALA